MNRRKVLEREAEAARRAAEQQESARLKDLQQVERVAAQACHVAKKEEIQRAKTMHMEQATELRLAKATEKMGVPT